MSAFGDRLYVVVLLVLAYNFTHSATTVALLNLMRLLPNALFLPFSGVLADRFNPKMLMIGADAGRGACMLGLLIVTSKSTLWVAFPLVFIATCLLSVFRPALNSSLPSVVGDDEQLIEANSLMNQMDAIAFVFAPALAGGLMLAGQYHLAFVINAATYAVSVGTLLLVSVPERPVDTRPKDEEGWLSEVIAGFRFLFRENEGVLGAVTLAFVGFQIFEGAFWALVIVLTLQIWHLGSEGTGLINVAYGVGGLLGGFLAGSLSRKLHSGSSYALTIAAQAAAVLLLGLSPGGPAPFILLGITGLANVVILILGFTIIQTASPRDLLGRSFSAFESTGVFSKVIGTVLVGPLIELAGARMTAVVIALGSFALLLVSLPRLNRLEPVLGVRMFLRRVPVLTSLSRVTLDDVASRLQVEQFPSGATIVRQGDRGEKLYIVKSGELEVLAHAEDQEEVVVGSQSQMDYFGEIALLHDVPRIATVRSICPVELYSLARADFQELVQRSEEFHESVEQAGKTRTQVTQSILFAPP